MLARYSKFQPFSRVGAIKRSTFMSVDTPNPTQLARPGTKLRGCLRIVRHFLQFSPNAVSHNNLPMEEAQISKSADIP